MGNEGRVLSTGGEPLDVTECCIAVGWMLMLMLLAFSPWPGKLMVDLRDGCGNFLLPVLQEPQQLC